MACIDRMEQLSLLDTEQPSTSGPSASGQGDHLDHLPFKQSIVAAKLDGVHTDIVISEYSNSILFVITQCKKIASFISVSKDIAQEGCGNQEELYVVRTIFGLEERQELVARFLAEQTNISKPAVFALGLQEHGPRTVRALATIINTHKSWAAIMQATFAQLVIGPPGSGKTTYCKKMAEFLQNIGRKVAVINIDPANDNIPYAPTVDISELITVEDAMQHLTLGPNGALIYCMEFLIQNMEWLGKHLDTIRDHYLLIDCPGQVELYTHHKAMNTLIEELSKKGFRLCTVHLIDSHYCSDPGKFISTLLLAMSSMLHLGLPHVNILSKIDILMQQKDRLQFGIDFYTDVLDLQYLLDALDDGPFTRRYCKLNAALVSLVEDYSIVSFLPLDINNKKSLLQVRNAVDRAGGWVYGQGEEKSVQQMLACAVGAQTDTDRIGGLRDALAEESDEEM